jgi:hypothetical protein
LKPLKANHKVLETKIEELSKIVQDLQEQSSSQIWYDNSDIKRLFNISESTLTRYRKEKKIPFTRLGGRILYPKVFFTNSLMEKLENKHLL